MIVVVETLIVHFTRASWSWMVLVPIETVMALIYFFRKYYGKTGGKIRPYLLYYVVGWTFNERIKILIEDNEVHIITEHVWEITDESGMSGWYQMTFCMVSA